MKDALRETRDAPVASPCINVCQVDTVAGWCLGCLRTLDEIAVWAQSSNAEKRAVLDRVAARRLVLRGTEPR
jgi:predicted Fe-S protein YdhL (DUF1289 family)